MSHPLTGPVYIEGAEPGDLLKVELRACETSDMPGVAVPGDPFSGHRLPGRGRRRAAASS